MPPAKGDGMEISVFCDKCGNEIEDGSKFCQFCGAVVNPAVDPATREAGIVTDNTYSKNIVREIQSKEDIKGQKVTENIYLCPDGAYRWVYEFDMIKNPAILFTVWRVLLMSFAIIMIFGFIIQLFDGGISIPDPEDLKNLLFGFGIFLLVFAAISVLAYFIVAASFGYKYMVLFTMNENEIEHRQMKSQFDKARAMGWLTAAAGLATGNIGRVGTGILAATKTSSLSTFSNVKKVKSDKRHSVIYVNETLEHNQIYADGADFDFVRNFIIEHCRNAKNVS